MPDDIQNFGPYHVPIELGFAVYANPDNKIVIRQDDPVDDDRFVVVEPSKVEKLIEFLRAVREEIRTDRADAAAEANDPSYVAGIDP